MNQNRNRILFSLVLTVFLGVTGCQNAPRDQLLLHVPSPAWEDQIIYFILVDRFNDGNADNNNQGAGEFDPADHRKFSGGDIQGIIDQLDYIQGLGVTALWLTPIVANQWWDPKLGYGGYHGYWAENFSEVDKHFGVLNDYQQLSDALHRRGMVLIQDIVVNHTGNFFDYGLEYDPDDLDSHFYPNSHSIPVSRPTEHPFSLNNPLDPNQRSQAIYHWTPSISDYNDPVQRIYYQLSGLDDINTENPVVRAAFRQIYGGWIQKAGVDGFRIDTIIYLEPDFWHDFLHSDSEAAPGIENVARVTGRENFLTFGEALLGSPAMDDSGDRQVASYQGSSQKPGVKSMINFPLYFTIGRVLGQGQPTSHLTYRLNAANNSDIYRNPELLTNFIDNHDVPRFLSSASRQARDQALVLLMTIPGIPVIYQGSEQDFSEQRKALFSGGWNSGGTDHFDSERPTYQLIRELAQLRKTWPVFRQGRFRVICDTEQGPGAFLYKRSSQDQDAVIVLNTADQPVLISNIATGLAPGSVLKNLYGIAVKDNWHCSAEGSLTQILPSRSAAVFIADGVHDAAKPDMQISLNRCPDGQLLTEDFLITGTVRPAADTLLLVIDGKLTDALEIQPQADGSWQVILPVDRFPFRETTHSLNIFDPVHLISSRTCFFKTDASARSITVGIADPAGDDHGPQGSYRLPEDVSFGGQMDILKLEAAVAGNHLQVKLTMKETSRIWMPPNGFDHVVFHVFIDLPGQTGADTLPLLNSKCPDGFNWDYMFYAGGWQKSLYRPSGSGTSGFGIPVTPAPDVSVDSETRTVTFQFLPGALSQADGLSGAGIYVTTWDGGGSEGFHRPLTKSGGMYEFGGSDDPNAPLIMDDTDVLFLP